MRAFRDEEIEVGLDDDRCTPTNVPSLKRTVQSLVKYSFQFPNWCSPVYPQQLIGLHSSKSKNGAIGNIEKTSVEEIRQPGEKSNDCCRDYRGEWQYAYPQPVPEIPEGLEEVAKATVVLYILSILVVALSGVFQDWVWRFFYWWVGPLNTDLTWYDFGWIG